ncbi:hypothetical protein LCGC14_2758430, partial [marine sediment metagenome]
DNNDYLSIGYPQSTITSLGSNYDILSSFIAYLKELI